MKKKLLLLSAFALTFQVWGQKYTKLVAESTCDCLVKKTLEGKNVDINLKVVTDCLSKSGFLEYYEKVAKEQDIDVSDGLNAESGRKLGERIGFKLMEMNCEPYRTFSYKLAGLDPNGKALNNDNTIEKPSDKITYFTDYFDFQRIENTDNFASIVAKDDKGREVKFWWFNYFKGSEQFQTTPNSLKDKKFAFTWWEEETYSLKLGDYVKIKVLKEIKE